MGICPSVQPKSPLFPSICPLGEVSAPQSPPCILKNTRGPKGWHQEPNQGFICQLKQLHGHIRHVLAYKDGRGASCGGGVLTSQSAG